MIYLPIRLPLRTDTQHKPVHRQKRGSCGNRQSVNPSAVPDPLLYANRLVRGRLAFIGGILFCLLIHLDCGTFPNAHTLIIRLCMHGEIDSGSLLNPVLENFQMTSSLSP